MTSNPKAELTLYLQAARAALLWKLDGLSEYDVRRPLVPTGTNLLGLVKHVASVESGYLGDVFGRPIDDPLVSGEDMAASGADMWARADESRDLVIEFYRRVWRHSDETIDSMDLDAVGQVPWWPEERRQVTLHRVLVHMIAETNRHGGHADIVRELIDGAVGMRADVPNLPQQSDEWWASYRDKLERVARGAT